MQRIPPSRNWQWSDWKNDKIMTFLASAWWNNAPIPWNPLKLVRSTYSEGFPSSRTFMIAKNFVDFVFYYLILVVLRACSLSIHAVSVFFFSLNINVRTQQIHQQHSLKLLARTFFQYTIGGRESNKRASENKIVLHTLSVKMIPICMDGLINRIICLA